MEKVHSKLFRTAEKTVTAIDYGNSLYFKNNSSKINTIVADFNNYNFEQTFDCIWCSHILEHQRNVGLFLEKIYSLLNENGVLAITVPPQKPTIVGGHVTIWNAGLLLYNLVLAGFDCKYAKIKKYDYNISIIVKKTQKTDISNLEYDVGDISKISKYLPENICLFEAYHDKNFDGDIDELNWDN